MFDIEKISATNQSHLLFRWLDKGSCARQISEMGIERRPRIPGRFDSASLFHALDTQRLTRGMTWKEVAAEIGVRASTLTRTKLGGRMEVDGMLAMVRWLGRSVESFTFGDS